MVDEESPAVGMLTKYSKELQDMKENMDADIVTLKQQCQYSNDTA